MDAAAGRFDIWGPSWRVVVGDDEAPVAGELVPGVGWETVRG